MTEGGAGPDSVTVQGPDGDRADARIGKRDGHTYVVPLAAETYLATGRLDTRLFDITLLLADGYDDGHRDSLPLIAGYSSAAGLRTARDSRTPLPGASAFRSLDSINGAAVTEDHGTAADFWKALTGSSGPGPGRFTAGSAEAPALAGGIKRIWLDGKAHADLADSVAQIGAPQVWAHNNTGQGVNVAVLDTGYDSAHPDLAGVTSAVSFVPGVGTTDRAGHGTHVASTIAGSGAASGGKERGVAPGVNLHVGKVLNDQGAGQESWIIAGMQWAARDAHARVVSMSLGGNPSDGTDPMSQAVDELSAETGTLFVIAAGNSGPDEHTVGAPGAADAALTVGAVDSQDTVAGFSSRGPRLRDDAVKPEITAPGVEILAARSQYASFGSGSYATLSGTSMATPHVAGTAALVAAAHPDWTGTRIKDALVGSAAPTPANTVDAGGNGRVDAVAATTHTLVATGISDAGIHTPGRGDAATVQKRVQYYNGATSPVTVDLAIDAPDVPAGVFSVADQRLTVPAGGTASTTVTTHLDATPAYARYTGRLTAAVGSRITTRTLLAVSTQEEKRHLRVKLIGNRDVPLGAVVSWQRKGDDSSGFQVTDSGVDTIVSPGTYTVWAWMPVRGTHGASSAGLALLAAPTVTVAPDHDSEVSLDGTKVRLTKVITRKATTDSYVRADFARTYAGSVPPVADTAVLGSEFDSLWALPISKPAQGDLTFTARWRMEQPQLTLRSGGKDFDDLWIQPGSAVPGDGQRTLPAVFAGAGTPADYAQHDVRGKIAVVDYVPDPDDGDDRTTAASAASVDQAKAAQQAGAAMLVLVNDLDGRLRQPISRSTLVVAGVSHSEGQELIARIRASASGLVLMQITGHTHTRYLYDLVHSWHGEIPARMEYAPAESRLARVEVNFHGDPATEVDEFRYDIQPYLGVKVGSSQLARVGAHRTDWVTADPDTTWMEEASETYRSYQFSGLVHYPVGQTSWVQWFGPVEHPRINVSQELPQRTGDSMTVFVPGWGDGGTDHAGITGPGSTDQETLLYQNGKLVAESPGGAVEADVSAAKAAYRLVTTTVRTGGYPYSTATRTEWGFDSAKPKQNANTPLPLVQLDYTLASDAEGKVERTAPLLVTPAQIQGVSTAAVRTDRVELSYDDGVTWHRAALDNTAHGARVRLDAPRRATFLTLRVHASDTHGNTVVQTVIRAAGLR